MTTDQIIAVIVCVTIPFALLLAIIIYYFGYRHGYMTRVGEEKDARGIR